MKPMKQILLEAQMVAAGSDDELNLYEGSDEIGRENDYPILSLSQDDYDDGIGRYVVTFEIDEREVEMVQERRFLNDGDVFTHDVVDMMFDILDPADMWAIIQNISVYHDGDTFEELIEREQLDEGIGDYIKDKVSSVGSHLSGKKLAKQILEKNNLQFPKYFTTVNKTSKEMGSSLLKRIFTLNDVEKEERALIKDARKSVKVMISSKLSAVVRRLLKSYKNPFSNPVDGILNITYSNPDVTGDVFDNNKKSFENAKVASNKFRSMIAQAFQLDKDQPPITETEEYAAKLTQHEKNKAADAEKNKPTAREMVDPLSIKPNNKVPTEATLRQIITTVMSKPKQYPITHGYILAYQEWLRRVFKQMNKVLVDQITDGIMVEDFEKIMGHYQSRLNTDSGNTTKSKKSNQQRPLDRQDIARGDNYGSRF